MICDLNFKAITVLFVDTNVSSPESPNKKRKPGRPKKCDLIKPGVTGNIVTKFEITVELQWLEHLLPHGNLF